MPWATSKRRSQLGSDWHKQRARVWRAVGGQCQAVDNGVRCTWVGRLNGDGGQCDHVYGPDDPTLQWLCKPHHDAKTRGESQRGRHPAKRLTRRPHPGLIQTK